MKERQIGRLLLSGYFIVGCGLTILLLIPATNSIVAPFLKAYILSSPIFIGIVNVLRNTTNNCRGPAWCLAISWAVLAAVLMFSYFLHMDLSLLPWLLTYVVITPLVAIIAWFLKK